MRRLLLASCWGLVALACPARAWDLTGHQVVDQIAWTQLSPAARKQVAELMPLLPRQFNGGRAYHFVTAGAWLDDMRSMPHYAWSSWHYVTEAWTPDGSGFGIPAGPSVVWAMHQSEEKWQQAGLSPEQKAEALATLVHTIADAHQPMHTCSRGNDKGGNGFLIYGVPFTDLWPGTPPNLHALWDAAYRFDGDATGIHELWKSPAVEERPAAPDDGVIAAEAAKLVARFPKGSFASNELSGTMEDWVHESYALACAKGYPPGEPPSQTEVRTIDPAFSHQAHEIAGRRIVQAGYRVAQELERLLAPAKND